MGPIFDALVALWIFGGSESLILLFQSGDWLIFKDNIEGMRLLVLHVGLGAKFLLFQRLSQEVLPGCDFALPHKILQKKSERVSRRKPKKPSFVEACSPIKDLICTTIAL